MGTILEARDLAVGYNGKAVFSGVSFTVFEGDFVCVVGPNGSGKTTLIRGILGLLKPLAGSVSFGEGLTATTIGFMPQESEFEPNFPATVSEIVLSGALNRKRRFGRAEKSGREKKLKRVLKLLGISGLGSAGFSELSGGERQKVLLARSLMATEKLLILDEPSNNLDAESRKDLYETLEKLNREGLTIMMITHDLDHDNLIGNKILSLRDEIFYGTTAEFVRKIHHEEGSRSLEVSKTARSEEAEK